jgi:hypothetical protein
MNAISALMLGCGALLTGGSVARWFDSYQSVLATLYRLHESHSCSGGVCQTFIDVAQNFGASAYPQQLFCIGLGLISLGVMSRIAARFRY